ncbi:unnamed protein product [Parnassius mnemosyne]|uniref:ATPase AAA-type core domain-containing protein n=1 Tax=Parnassius mnemosyne TaxID=213953 RepID=A0AAV1KWI1_9NEOP
MSICLDTVVAGDIEKVSKSYETDLNKNARVVLKCNEKVLKPKCNKELKRKLKKYKLRKHGKEDQEIIDVSQTFNSSLTIKSPNNNTKSVTIDTLQNSDLYLLDNIHSFNMGRRKKDNYKTNSIVEKVINPIEETDSSITNADKEDKKQMDAFKLLMDSRNKIIGSNSPGKLKNSGECNVQDVIEKKEIKARRILSLQKMAQAKGALQKQEMEELRETCIKQKMEERAERLKSMISKNDLALAKHVKNPQSKSNTTDKKSDQTHISKIGNILNTKNNSYNHDKTPNFSNNSIPINNNGNTTMSQEEEEFLKKLSPSLKKKENMLCYFKKVPKDTEISIDNSHTENINSNQTIIKVKFTPKNKKKKKLDLIENNLVNNNQDIKSKLKDDNMPKEDCLSENAAVNENTDERRKRKRKKHIKESVNVDSVEISPNDTRPKRNIRKPLKYVDDIFVSSDEELHIFTPKKKKNLDIKSDSLQPNRDNNINEIKYQTSEKISLQYVNKRKSKPNRTDKKQPKLAPIFTTKSQVTAEELKAKQKFLHSGIPSHIKKNTSQQANTTSGCDVFHTVVHVQQIVPKADANVDCFTSSVAVIECDDELKVANVLPDLFKSLLISDVGEKNIITENRSNVEAMLHSMKQMYSKFPVYRTYHLLKAKSRGEFGDTNNTNIDNSVEIINGFVDTCNDNPDKLKWTDKYKATSTKQLIGNFESIKELKKWLVSWTESDVSVRHDSDSSDFYHSDSDSGDAIRMRNNLLILTGKIGTGKTSSVYAVASELSIKVIEVNASNKRTGKIMLQDLQEATQSHKVDRQRDCIDNSQKSLERDANTLPKIKKRGRPAKNKEILSQSSSSIVKKDTNSEPFSSQESLRTDMSLILIDDADIVFEQDDGFCSAIAQLIHSSKRPVILIAESSQCPHLQKYLKYGQIINMQPLLPRMLGIWLDIMCLADNGTCYPGLGAMLLDFFKGDIRKSINCLQYYMTSQKYISKQEDASQRSEFNDKQDVNDETSSMSWAVNDDLEENISYANTPCNSSESIQYFIGKQLNLQYPSPSLVFNVWWSMPNLLSLNMYDIKIPVCKHTDTGTNEKNNLNLQVFASTIDTISLLDCLQNTTAECQSDITSNPWFSPENASLIETENFECYDKNNEMRQDISQWLMTSSIRNAQKKLGCKQKTDLQFPSMTWQRERDKIVSRHKNLASYLNPSSMMDRKAVALDYWSCCRTICRLEKTKTDSNSKRNNRFCHYLKSLNVLCKNDYFDKLGDSLYLNENT